MAVQGPKAHSRLKALAVRVASVAGGVVAAKAVAVAEGARQERVQARAVGQVPVVVRRALGLRRKQLSQ
jgi:hypothetical protein